MSIAWPDPSPPPPPPPPPVHVPVPEAEVKRTRKKMAMWDRTKILIVIALLFTFLVWNDMADNPIIPFSDALREPPGRSGGSSSPSARGRAAAPLPHLRALDPVQHVLGRAQVFGRFNRRVERMNPWTAVPDHPGVKFVVVSVVLWRLPRRSLERHADRGALPSAEPALRPRSSRPRQGLPFIFQIVMLLGLAVGQFVAIFWFLSRGGVDTYMPGRHQDPVLRRVGPGPRARAGQGEHRLPRGARGDRGARAATCRAASCSGGRRAPARRSWPRRSPARPASRSCSSIPAPSSTCSSGVGILKVKSLFRKLRKLALRYGGVIVFFDEADTLGNRGGSVAQGRPSGRSCNEVLVQRTCCNGAPLRRPTHPPGAAMVAPAASRPDGADVPARRLAASSWAPAWVAAAAAWARCRPCSPSCPASRSRAASSTARCAGVLTHAAEAAAEVPHPRDDGDEHARRRSTQALLRPGRIDRIYKVGYPSTAGRKRTFEGYLDKVKHITDARRGREAAR